MKHYRRVSSDRIGIRITKLSDFANAGEKSHNSFQFQSETVNEKEGAVYGNCCFAFRDRLLMFSQSMRMQQMPNKIENAVSQSIHLENGNESDSYS